MGELPQIPAFDFFLGLISAGILLWLMLCLTRSRAFDHFWTLPAEGDEDEAPLFTALNAKAEGTQVTFLVSLFGHVFFIALIPMLELMLPGGLGFNFNRYDIVLVQFKMDDGPLKIPKDVRDFLREEQQRRRDELATERALPLPGELKDPGIGNQKPAPKLAEDTVGKDGSKAEELARFEILTPRRSTPSNPALKDTVKSALLAPNLRAKSERLDDIWRLDPPDLTGIPNPGIPALAELNLADAPEIGADAALSALVFGGDDPLSNMSPALVELAVSALQGGLDNEGLDRLLAMTDGQGNDGAFQLGAALRAGVFGPFSGAGAGAEIGFGSGFAAGASGSDGDGLGVGLGGLSPLPRKLHGIILVANDAQLIPEAAGVLTGNPIYTVFVPVPGFVKKWVLQVCLPPAAAGSVEVDGGVIRVLSRKSVAPPYAFLKTAPELALDEVDAATLPPRVVIYAKFDEHGDIGDMRIVSGAEKDIDDRLMASLESWEFHPAFRDGEPVAVEAVFGIPLR
jgi:hypothetical protein